MAEVFLSALVKTMMGNLNSLLLQQFETAQGVKKELGKLENTLSTINDVLQDAEEQQVKSQALKNWLMKLKGVAYDADDLIDEFLTEAFRQKVRTGPAMMNRVRNFFSLPNSLVFYLKMGRRIKEIGERLCAIAEERKFHLRDGAVDPPVNTEERLQTDSLIESEVFGRDEDKKKIVESLIHVGTQEDVSIIPIVGMGGLGKTTLAQFTYNDDRVTKHFELRMWVCVSDNFDVMRVLKLIIESANGSKCDLEGMDSLQHGLQQKLSGKKFLLVLDDVWEENPEKWNSLKKSLRGARGSKIIVTTRIENVALIMGTLPSHHLPILSDDDCWSLFRQRAFGHGRQEHPNLVMLGKEIVKKCGGVPLAAKALGSLMYLQTEESQWLFVKESEIWNIQLEKNPILPALRLSYYHLPSHLKQCFAYCSIFPKDYRIKKDKLIQLWMAEGFIQSSVRSNHMENIGGEYFNNLLRRFFFQDVEKDDDGNIVWCKMHDLMHDLASFVAGTECSIVQVANAESIHNISRRLSLDCGYSRKVQTFPKALKKVNHLRTLLLLEGRSFSIPGNHFVHFTCLRVLDLSEANVTQELLVSIGKLKHLRYLDLSYTNIKSLPESISTLHHLQTLKLLHCNYIAELPRDMSKMTSLRHLEIDWYNDKLTHMPANMGELKFLQTLPIFIIGQDRGCGIKELQDLNLRGSLIIRNLENVMCRADAQEANLKEKPNLHKLCFKWGSWGQDIDLKLAGNVEETLEGLRPHPNLERLEVKGYVGVRFPHWMTSSLLSNLVEISLSHCRRCEQLPQLGQLPLLKVLVIQLMDAVKSIGNHFYGDNVAEGFPSLKELTLKDMPNLEEWSGFNGREVLPCLNQLSVVRCPKLTTLPCLQSLKILTLNDSNEMLLGSVANLTSLSYLSINDFKALRSLSGGLFPNQTRLLILKISRCPKLESLSGELGNLAALVSLSVHKCDELVLLPEELQNLTSLQNLNIYECNGLTSLRLQGLSSLIDLSIQYCKSLTSLMGSLQHLTAFQSLYINKCLELASLPEDMQHLMSLRVLEIWDCDKLTCLPEGLKHVTTLQELSIGGLKSLTALPEWIGNLSSLQHLYISRCDKLGCLPSGLQLLTNLQTLQIYGCPQLEKRCEKEKGEDWHYIAHIPDFHIFNTYTGSESKSKSPRGGKGCGRMLGLKRR
ncbi:putative disease resistance protein RGA4 [Magnolia sinica]|uniref:putative disease resistance protein RGA4 n=1 Tax=Magnolia sinica TaxID=86752 RepID=UPI002658183A|nr:putative disease resistance protein RGA4 [Magnolia sinica]